MLADSLPGIPRPSAPDTRHATRDTRPSLIHLDLEIADDLRPLGGLIADELVELRRGVADRHRAFDRVPLLHLRIGQYPDDVAVQAVDDRLRRAGRGEHAVPSGRVVAGKAGFRDGRD